MLKVRALLFRSRDIFPLIPDSSTFQDARDWRLQSEWAFYVMKFVIRSPTRGIMSGDDCMFTVG